MNLQMATTCMCQQNSGYNAPCGYAIVATANASSTTNAQQYQTSPGNQCKKSHKKCGKPDCSKPGCKPTLVCPIPPCPVPRRSVPTWKINYIVSDRINRAAHVDPDLINPWGIVVFSNQLWIANNGSDTVTNYDLFGNKLLASVTIRSQDKTTSFPTGIAINCGGEFTTSNGSVSRAAIFMVCANQGSVSTYNPTVDARSTVVTLNQQELGQVAAFKGIATVNNQIYLADFYNKQVDVFNSSYVEILPTPFIDLDTTVPIPSDYGPNNIVYLAPYMYVLWARQDPNVPISSIDGPGNGFISIFNLDGSFVKRFTSQGVLNSPWGMIPAPLECGFPPGSFMVSNNGDGRINIFDSQGRFVGPLLNQRGLPIIINGIRGLAPYYTNFTEIFFSSSEDERNFGLVGSFVKDQVIYF